MYPELTCQNGLEEQGGFVKVRQLYRHWQVWRQFGDEPLPRNRLWILPPVSLVILEREAPP